MRTRYLIVYIFKNECNISFKNSFAKIFDIELVLQAASINPQPSCLHLKSFNNELQIM